MSAKEVMLQTTLRRLDMRRREFIKYVGAIATASPVPVRAQQNGMRVIGLLAPNPKVLATVTMESDLAEFGWEAKRNLQIIARTSTGTNEALPALAADLVAQKVDLIFATGDRATIAAQRYEHTDTDCRDC